MTARLIKEKGVQYYLKAAQLIKKKYPDVRFLLLGGLDDYPSKLSSDYIKKYIDSGAIEWLGHVEVKYWLSTSSVFVLPITEKAYQRQFKKPW